MLSNLVKQYYVAADPKDNQPVVINSNERMSECMQEHAREQARKQAEERAGMMGDGDGFREGLTPVALDEEGNTVVSDAENPEATSQTIISGPTYEEIIAKAQEEAQTIVADARKQADQILLDADQNAKLVFEEQKQAGYLAGEEQSREEAQQIRQDLERQYANKGQSLQEEYDKKSAAMEADIVDAIIQVFDRVFHIQFEDQRAILLHLVQNTMQDIQGEKHFKIHACADNIAFFETKLPALREKVGSDVELELVYDASLSQEGCRIETESGVFDCGIDTELSNIYKEIRSLCG